MAARKKASEKAEEHPKAAEAAPEQPSTEEVYAGYVSPVVPDKVEVRVNGKVVFYNDVYGASVSTLSGGGVSVKGSSEAPKSSSKKSEPDLYNPQEQESAAAMAAQAAPVPETDPEYTEALDESATPDGDES